MKELESAVGDARADTRAARDEAARLASEADALRARLDHRSSDAEAVPRLRVELAGERERAARLEFELAGALRQLEDLRRTNAAHLEHAETHARVVEPAYEGLDDEPEADEDRSVPAEPPPGASGEDRH